MTSAAPVRRADGRLSRTEAKAALLRMVKDGMTARDAIARLGYVESTYEQWRRSDPIWAQHVSLELRAAKTGGRQRPEDRILAPRLPFAEWSAKYVGAQVFPHVQNVVDVIEKREPSWIHPSMNYTPGDNDLVIVNMPPEHAKTMSISINYATYATCMNPNIRGLIVSKTGQMSQKMLYAIKDRLTGPTYADLIRDYAPRGGFQSGSGKWTQDTIYLSPEVRDSGEKDPTWQALGIGSQIYGARADLVILDDCIDSTNAHDFARQIDWIQSHVLSRLSTTGVLLLIGTRLAPADLYMEVQRPELYPDERSPWTYLAMPAVLEFADKQEDWVTLWPKTNMRDVGNRDEQPDADGMFPKWDGPRLFKKRARMLPALWARVYQQQQVAEDTVFDPEDVRGCVNGRRLAGLIPSGLQGVRPEGMSGLTVVAGLDPATSGHTAMVVIGLDAPRKKRYVLDVFNKPALKPDEIREAIYRLTEKYGIHEWVVETNGFQGFLAHDREVNTFLASRGCIVRPHHTGNNKRDPDFGVSAMAALFAGWREGHNLIELPSTYNSEGVKALVEQLNVWAPGMDKHQKTDAVMALWMAELACLRRVEMMSGYNRSHVRNQFLTRWDAAQRRTVDLTDIEVHDSLVRSL
jgi:hypothetical protein